MRVIAGRLGGRVFAGPRGQRTHPMSEKARGALFNTLGDLSGQTVLDAFAGSGALSIEAVSRGAQSVLAVDIDVDAVKTIAANVRELELEDAITVRRKNISGWAKNNQSHLFDVVLADPPYDDIRPTILALLTRHVTIGGVFVLSWPGREPLRPFADCEILSHHQYGDAQLVFYRRVQ